MKSIKKIKTTLVASIENFVNEVENQEAIISSVIQELKEALVTHQQQIREMERRRNSTRTKNNHLQVEIKSWNERAARVKNNDLEKAKECLKKVIILEDDIKRNERLIETLDRNLVQSQNEGKVIREKLNEIQLKRNQLLAKESTLKAKSMGRSVGGDMEIENVLNRWEDKVMAKDFSYTCDFKSDGETLDEEFKQEELDLKIEERLSALD
ncbi:hypothetical protein N9N67_08040 [Bacteriovoracaceae bacterium]|nr:hypothetical protein [Bacteriovoracaceae bacterium]